MRKSGILFGIGVLALLALGYGCAEKPAAERPAEQRCVGTFSGTWSGQIGGSSATLIAKSDCGFVFSSDWTRCTAQGVFSPLREGKTDVSISQNSGGFPCPAVGGHSCLIAYHTADDIIMDCGPTGSFAFKRL